MTIYKPFNCEKLTEKFQQYFDKMTFLKEMKWPKSPNGVFTVINNASKKKTNDSITSNFFDATYFDNSKITKWPKKQIVLSILLKII